MSPKTWMVVSNSKWETIRQVTSTHHMHTPHPGNSTSALAKWKTMIMNQASKIRPRRYPSRGNHHLMRRPLTTLALRNPPRLQARVLKVPHPPLAWGRVSAKMMSSTTLRTTRKRLRSVNREPAERQNRSQYRKFSASYRKFKNFPLMTRPCEANLLPRWNLGSTSAK